MISVPPGCNRVITVSVAATLALTLLGGIAYALTAGPVHKTVAVATTNPTSVLSATPTATPAADTKTDTEAVLAPAPAPAPTPVDHSPHVLNTTNYEPGCIGTYSYQQSTSSGHGIIIDARFPYTYATYDTPTGYGVRVFNCS